MKEKIEIAFYTDYTYKSTRLYGFFHIVKSFPFDFHAHIIHDVLALEDLDIIKKKSCKKYATEITLENI